MENVNEPIKAAENSERTGKRGKKLSGIDLRAERKRKRYRGRNTESGSTKSGEREAEESVKGDSFAEGNQERIQVEKKFFFAER